MLEPAIIDDVEATLALRAVRVLLVDDQPIIAEAVRRMLGTQDDIAFHYCDDPLQALERAREIGPTVILCDLVMPGMDGLELLTRLREAEATRRIPLILLSSREDPETKAQAFRHGANDYMVKLPDPVELIARVRHHSEGYISQLQRDAAYRELKRNRQALADDLDEAERYVQSLLPRPTTEGLIADWRFVPSASLGGDAFGYHWLDDDHFAVYLLDVSGHGVGSALLGVSVLNTLRARALPDTDFRDPGRVVTRLNTTYRTQDHGGKFFTIWYGVWRASTRTLAWAGAGHPAGLFFEDPDAPGAAALLVSGGPMPGVLHDLAYETQTREVPSGARLLVYSDGVYELHDADGRVRTHDEFLAQVEQPGERSLDAILDHAQAVRGEEAFLDDVSLVQVDFP